MALKKVHWRVADYMELLHIHDTSAAIDKSAVIYLGNITISGENVLLSFICILILVELFANDQTINIRIIAVLRQSRQLI